MFTEKCFIRKYSQELVNKLVELGHNVMRFQEPRYIVCDKNDVYLTSTLPNKDIDECTDCDVNEELFLAIASIRNDKPDYQWFVWDDDGVCSTEVTTIWYNEIVSSIELFDLFNKKMFDYRGLIPMGLAIAVTKENNPYERK